MIKLVFFLAAAAALAAMLYHVKGFMNPTPLRPAWRHAVFVAVNTALFYGLLKRPDWFTWFFGLVTLQQLYSHGSSALAEWHTQHRVDWISVLVITGMPLLFFLLLRERRRLRKKVPAN
ncbi:MAG: hypothetical protein U0X40_10910 [Ferruginibacter sp.]